MVFETPESAKERPILLLLIISLHFYFLCIICLFPTCNSNFSDFSEDKQTDMQTQKVF